FRWAAGVMTDLGTPNGDNVTRAMSVSNDGTALAGNSNSGSFRWATGTGFQVFPGAGYGISGDGTEVVGWAFQNGGSHAYRWTVSGGMQDLGVLPGGPLS